MINSPVSFSNATVLAIFAIFSLSFNWFRHRNARRLPPGPKGYPLIGNMFDMMDPEIWEAARKWGNTCGADLICLKTFGKSLMVINSYETACEILGKRALNYSDRPYSVMLNELQKWNWPFSIKDYGDDWRRMRTPMQKFFGAENLVKFDSALEHEALKLLRKLLHSPKDYELHIRTVVASSIMLLTYGHEVTTFDDPFVTLARNGVAQLSLSLRQGLYIVDVLPWLKHLPEWFPGAGFQTIAKHGAKVSHDVQYLPYYDARHKTLSGTTTSQSFTSQEIESCEKADGKLVEEDEDRISAIAGIAYLGGADTSSSSLMSLLLAFTLYPDVQKHAQAEIDSIVESGVRLPRLSDRTQLPYCVALCKEIQRWAPVAPIGAPHTSREDDTYNGYHIPAKSVFLPNQWAMLQDPEEYPDPGVFRPERFLPSATGERMQRDPVDIAFGFGRRVCPGRFLAENTIFIMAIQILAVFDISKSVDDSGKIIEPNVKFTQEGLVRQPLPFECTIKPRSKEAAELIELE